MNSLGKDFLKIIIKVFHIKTQTISYQYLSSKYCTVLGFENIIVTKGFL